MFPRRRGVKRHPELPRFMHSKIGTRPAVTRQVLESELEGTCSLPAFQRSDCRSPMFELPWPCGSWLPRQRNVTRSCLPIRSSRIPRTSKRERLHRHARYAGWSSPQEYLTTGGDRIGPAAPRACDRGENRTADDRGDKVSYLLCKATDLALDGEASAGTRRTGSAGPACQDSERGERRRCESGRQGLAKRNTSQGKRARAKQPG